MSRVIVVGGGPAGCIAAVTAAECGHQVTLYEKNEKIGKKLFITGKGRCNVTNGCPAEELFQNVVSNPKFLYSAFYSFDNNSVCDFFEQAGCRLKTERGERVFPASDHSSDVLRALEKRMRDSKVKVRLNSAVDRLQVENNKVTSVTLKDSAVQRADAVVIATGGISYPLTGSTGDGFRFAEECGLKVTELRPALVPLETREEWCRQLQGLALKNVEIKLSKKGKKLYDGFGEMLFTHFGVSGPLALTASSYYAKAGGEGEALMELDLKPALPLEQLDKRLQRDFEENRKKQFKNAVGGLFPSKLIPVMIELSGIDPEKKVQDITREERKQFAEKIKRLTITVTGTRDIKEAIITQGGISVKEVNPSTMESKKIKGLYLAGEVLDLDALTGGFNLQIAWSTGYLAGSSIE